MNLTFAEANRRFPACCVGAWDEQETISSLVFAVEHELTMYAENQDGCITAKEASECKRYLGWLRESGVNTFAILRGEGD